MATKERDDAAARREEALRAESAPPSELGDVEDAVAEEVGGDLTEWAPPDDEASGETSTRDAKA